MYGYHPHHNGGRPMGNPMHGYAYGYRPWGGVPQHPPPPPPPPPPPVEEDYEEEEEEEEEDIEEDEEEEQEELQVEGEIDEDEEDGEEEEGEYEIVENGDVEEEQELVAKSELPKNRKRPRPSAFAYLQSLVREGSYEMSSPAQNVLRDLLREEHIQLAEPATDADCALQHATTRQQSKRVVDDDMPDEEIVELAKNNDVSYLGSFLKAIEEGTEQPVTARHLIRRCCLAASPAFVPASMDAEDFALAALEFLETSIETNDHPHLPRLPLVRAVMSENDIRKRAYVKAYEWNLSDILDSIVYLENIFLSDASNFKWLRREAFGPMNMDAAASEALFLKGKFRASSAKKKTPASRKKAKVPASGSSVNSGPTSSKGDPVATEASRIMQQAGRSDDSF